MNLIKYPTVWVTIVGFGVCLFSLCLINPKGGQDRDKPSLADEDILFRKKRDEKVNLEEHGQEVNYLNKYLPNKDKVGNGMIPLLKVYEQKDNSNCQDENSEKPCCSMCTLQFKLYILYLRNNHTLLSMFQRTAGTNFTLRERIACFFMYLVTIMVASAMFYGQEHPRFGAYTASFLMSLIATIPVFFVRYLITSSKPRINESERHVLGLINSDDIRKSLGAKEDQNTGMIADNVEQKNVKAEDAIHQTRGEEYAENFLTDLRKGKHVTIHDARLVVAKLENEGRYKEQLKFSDRIRIEILNSTYTCPSCCKIVAWLFVVLWSSVCVFLSIWYGLLFDILVEKSESEADRVLYQKDCWSNNMELVIRNKLSQESVSRYFLLKKQQKDIIRDFGPNATDAQTWLFSVGISIFLSMVVWQPLTIYITSWIRLWLFTYNLKTQLLVETACALCQKTCGCENKEEPTVKPRSKSMADMDWNSLTTNRFKRLNSKCETVTGLSVVAAADRPLDILGFISHDVFFYDEQDHEEKKNALKQTIKLEEKEQVEFTKIDVENVENWTADTLDENMN